MRITNDVTSRDRVGGGGGLAKPQGAPEPPVADLQRVNVGRYLLKAGHALETGVS